MNINFPKKNADKPLHRRRSPLRTRDYRHNSRSRKPHRSRDRSPIIKHKPGDRPRHRDDRKTRRHRSSTRSRRELKSADSPRGRPLSPCTTSGRKLRHPPRTLDPVLKSHTDHSEDEPTTTPVPSPSPNLIPKKRFVPIQCPPSEKPSKASPMILHLFPNPHTLPRMTFPNSPICEPTPNPTPTGSPASANSPVYGETEEDPLKPAEVVPSLTVVINNSPKKTPDPLITVPTMNDFDQETLMDHRRQSHAFMHILGLCKVINRNVYRKLALFLKDEGLIKED